MKFTERTRRRLFVMRTEKRLKANGFTPIRAQSSVNTLCPLDRGFIREHVITECIVGPDGKSIWFKTAPQEQAA